MVRRSSKASSLSSVCFVSTYPPSRCGIANYTCALVEGLIADRGPDAGIAVARVLQPVAHLPSRRGEVIGAFRPDDPTAVTAIARRLDSYDVAVIQHEYGIYGPREGRAVRDLVDQIAVPVVTVLHTLRREPSPLQRRIVEHLAERSLAVVVLSRAAALYLGHAYDVESDKVILIPHGALWRISARTPLLQPVVLTWGLLSRGKGLERGILAMEALRTLRPTPVYRIVGRTHPTVMETEGESYRRELEELVAQRGLGDMVAFEAAYLTTEDLAAVVAGCQVVLLPYLSEEQVTSGVLSEALGAGKPVVATRFPHAEELLGTGAGIVVDHGDVAAIGEALRTLLTDVDAYRAAASEAVRVGAELGWSQVTRRYTELFASVSGRRATAVA